MKTASQFVNWEENENDHKAWPHESGSNRDVFLPMGRLHVRRQKAAIRGNNAPLLVAFVLKAYFVLGFLVAVFLGFFLSFFLSLFPIIKLLFI